MIKTAATTLLTLAIATPAVCQTSPPPARTIDLAGPRFGVTFLGENVARKLKTSRQIDVGRTMTQVGWQFEKQFYNGKAAGPTALTEAVVLLGGLEQGVVLPSVSWLFGVRTRSGVEFGVGPNATPVGVALAAAAGMTLRAGVMNVPVNVAVVHSKSGMRVSVLSGFSLWR
jgi:hypothetical protein